MQQLNSKLSRTTETLGTILDKAMCEEVFRWQLITKTDEIIEKYHITEKNDLEVLNDLVEKMHRFILDRLSESMDIDDALFAQNVKSYKMSNPNLKYEDALKKIGDGKEKNA